MVDQLLTYTIVALAIAGMLFLFAPFTDALDFILTRSLAGVFGYGAYYLTKNQPCNG